jgi:hypothetical protein
MRNKSKDNIHNKKFGVSEGWIIILLIIVLFILFSQFVLAQVPEPHNVEGRVFTDNSQSIGVSGGLPVRINDTVSGDVVITYTQDPGPPPLKGIYSATINGNDGDLIIVESWNATHWGSANTTLLSTTTTVNIVYNRTRNSEPNVTIIIPNNNSIRNTTDLFNVTANVTILGNDGVSCDAAISFSNNAANITSDQSFTNSLGNINFHQSKTTTWNVTGKKEGILDITVTAQCNSDGVNLEKYNSYTINISISDTTKPTVNLISPTNNTWLNKDNITFEYNVTENSGIKNCSLYFDNKLNQTSYNLPVDTLLNFTLNNTPEGSHEWFVSCFDNGSNFNQGNGTTRIINIDVTPPNVTLLAPANNTSTPNNTILFEYNVSDNFNVANCSLIIDNEIILNNNSIGLNISNNFTKTLVGSNYTWQVNCTDNVSNIGSSVIFFLNITDPDLKISSSDIIFSAGTFVENENITINATIFNLGTENATNVTVQFFENDPDIDGIQIGTNKTINISISNNLTVSETYITKVGKVDIFVIVDPPLSTNGSITELNESNNKANRSIDIPAYHIFYGDIVSDIFLDTSSNTTVFAWLNATDITGNIFVADSDSNIDFNSLQALSRNTSNNLTIDDFEELDIALSTVNLSDSINRTYTENSVVKNTDNFTVFSSNIINVPIANSTNTSNFITGILWDTSDFNSIGFYNGSQDIAFVTKISKDSVGFYGTYDYELKIPANLKRYLTPNVQNSISFYREIT